MTEWGDLRAALTKHGGKTAQRCPGKGWKGRRAGGAGNTLAYSSYPSGGVRAGKVVPSFPVWLMDQVCVQRNRTTEEGSKGRSQSPGVREETVTIKPPKPQPEGQPDSQPKGSLLQNSHCQHIRVHII